MFRYHKYQHETTIKNMKIRLNAEHEFWSFFESFTKQIADTMLIKNAKNMRILHILPVARLSRRRGEE